ncbi:MAG: amidohydrolase [Acidimicrobiia bacterium]|nr:amidohydrolase [Acidimicrobiia bacterium]
MGDDLRYLDADGHLVEHPTGLQNYAPHGFRDKVWHVETDAKGLEWVVMGDGREPANVYAAAAVAGFTDEEKQQAWTGQMRYSQIPGGAYDTKERLAAMDEDMIDVSVLYPTMLLGLSGYPDRDVALATARAYNDWLADHCGESDGRLYGAAVVPQWDAELAAAEIRRSGATRPMVAAFLRPNPTLDWKPLSDRAYDPIWKAACDANVAIGFHPLLAGDMPGACRGLRINELRFDTPWMRGEMDLKPPMPGMTIGYDNNFFAQAISNPVDMMTTIAFMIGGGVLQRFPDLRVVFLESNGGWIVPWLERLDHHFHEFGFDVPWLNEEPSTYFRRQCWISFDPDESTLAFTANSPLVGADRIVWASDYPHPDAKYPGTTRELDEAMETLGDDQRELIAGANTAALYALDA